MQEIGSIGKSNNLSINCIPNNREKYMAFMVGKHLVFLDSFQFIASSLERLDANLPTDAFKYTSQVFQNDKLALMKQKGVYPYDYMDSFQKFGDQQLPQKEQFYSILTDEGISDAQYQYAQKGMILEVDLEYPKELHELHNDYPLAAEKIKVTKEMLTPYCKNIQEQFGISIGQVAKLIPTLSSKKNYVLHYRNLQLYLSLDKALWEDKQLFDNSDYPKDSLYFSVENKKIIGKFKDEAAGMPIREFIGLRSKMYSYVKDSGKNEKTAKGVRKYVIKKNITHHNYKDCLLNGKQMLHSMRTIRSDHHQIGS
ncbi:unnamed protein product, partial [Porites evermanni]